MIVRYLARRAIGVFMRLGRTLRGQKRPSRAETTTGASGAVNGPHKPTQEVEP